MLGRRRVKKDVRDSVWYIELRTMYRDGKIDWIIESTHDSYKEALNILNWRKSNE